MFNFNKCRFVAMVLVFGVVLSGCGKKSPFPDKDLDNSAKKSAASTGEAVSGDAAGEMSSDDATEQAENITRKLTLDEKLSLMVVNYEDISTMYRYFPGSETPMLTLDGRIPEVYDSLMKVRDLANEKYPDLANATDKCLMMSIAAYPKISAMVSPSFLSSEMVTLLLRTEFGYDGVVYTPPLRDKRLIDRYPVGIDGDVYLEAIKAGCDVLYQPYDSKKAIQTLRIAVNTNHMSVDRINASVVRIIRQKLLNGKRIGINRIDNERKEG